MKRVLLIAALLAVQPALTFSQSLVDSGLKISTVGTEKSFSQPTNMVFIGENDLLVSEKGTGLVRRMQNGTIMPQAVLDLAVSSDWERGLLSLALDPQFGTAGNNFVYAYYSRSTEDAGAIIDTRLSRFTWNGSSLSGEQVLLTFHDTEVPSHTGGIITFGPPTAAPADQKLFLVIGDRDRSGQLQNHAGGGAPDDTAVVIRVNRDGSTPSGSDKGPFFDVPGANDALKRTYAYGVRNSFGMDFDPESAALWISENGPELYDEINRLDPGTNGGWRRVMGPSTRPDSVVSGNGLNDLVFFGSPAIGAYSEPEFSWKEPNAPTSLHFLRSTALGAGYENDCFVGCFRGGKLYRFEMNPARTGFVVSGDLADLVVDQGDNDDDSEIVFGTGFGVVTDLETGPDGMLYVLSFEMSSGDGTVHRIEQKSASAAADWQLFR